jgi:hypothetical protein
MRQDTAEKYADDEAGRASAAPHSQSAVPLATFGERRVQQRQGGRKNERSAQALERTRHEQLRRPC